MPRMPTPADTEALEIIAVRAKCAVARIVKARARDFAGRPILLETLVPGLATAKPETMIEVGDHLLENVATDRNRWFGFGGEISALNARALRLLGRVLRHKAAQDR
jgi:hypothetical protein